MTQTAPSDTVLIVDFGSQVTQLIARRVRETGVYCEIVPFQSAEEGFARLKPRAVILSGSPASTVDEGSPRAPQVIFDSGVPVFGICYGQQTMCVQLGGKVESGHHREFGRAFLDVEKECALFEGIWPLGSRHQVWMSHGDRATALPEGFEVVATSPNAPYAFIANEAKKYYAVQFHPEVVHTPDGAKLIANFVHNIAGLQGDWTMSAYRARAVEAIRKQVGNKRVICALSGGVDSSVAALLIHEAVGEQLTCILVDHGLMRKNEAADVVAMFREHYNLHLLHIDASDRFISALEGESDPEKKRKTIGRLFIEVFEEEAKKLGGADFLAQAEHDTAAQAMLMTDDAALADAVEAAVERQLKTLPRGETAAASWRDFGAVILVDSFEAALPLANRIAAEHVELAIDDAEAFLSRLRNAGAVFLGRHTPEVIGDYVGGSNHVLPTARSARFSSGLSVLDFVKRTSVLKLGAGQLRELGPAAIALATAEGLDAHARSVAIRLNM